MGTGALLSPRAGHVGGRAADHTRYSLWTTLALLALVAACAGAQTVRASVADGLVQCNGNSWGPSISGNGRYIAFESMASDLVPGDTNGFKDIFVHDRDTRTTTRVSLTSAGWQANGHCYTPSISGDGRYVAFASDASNLVVNDTNARSDIFVRDTWTGVTTRESVTTFGTQGEGPSTHPDISADGRWVVFATTADNLLGFGVGGVTGIARRDRTTPQTQWITQSTRSYADFPCVSDNGQFVGYQMQGPDPGDPDRRTTQIYVRDVVAWTIALVSESTGAVRGNNHSQRPCISGDGNFVAFESLATNLDGGGPSWDIFVRDIGGATTTLVSKSSIGTAGNGGSFRPNISANGRYVCFESEASSLVVNDTNGVSDIFVHDQQTGLTSRVSIATDGRQADNRCQCGVISDNAMYVAFCGLGANLVPGDTNAAWDIFLTRRWPDLVVSDLNVIPDPVTGLAQVTATTDTLLQVTVTNQGAAAAPPCNLELWFHRADPAVYGATGDLTLATPLIPAGESWSPPDTVFQPTFDGPRDAWALVDSQQVVNEVNESNNATDFPYAIVYGPDLAFQTFDLVPNPIELGMQVTLTTTIINQGTINAAPCTVQIWQHRADPPPFGPAGDFTHVTGVLGPGATQQFVDNFTPGFAGDRTARGVVDADRVIFESNEGNNTASFAYSIVQDQPDLVAFVAIQPDPVMLGRVTSQTVTVQNVGTAGADPFTVGVWYHRGAAPVAGSPADVTRAVPGGLEASNTWSETFVFTPNYTGPREAWAFADWAEDVPESNEGNNAGSAMYSVTPVQPDLTSTVLVQPNPLLLGRTATLTATVQNIGTAPAGPFTLGAWRHRDVAPTWGSTPDVGWLIDPLDPGETETHSDQYIPSFGGDRIAWTFADLGNAIVEMDETNNADDDPYSIITQPDLTAAVTVAPDPVTTGALATVTVDVQNVGDGNAGPFTLAVWEDRDPTGAPWGVPGTAEFSFAGLVAGGTETRTVVFAAGTVGSHCAQALVDCNGEVDESAEINNWMYVYYDVTDAPASSGVLAVTAAGATPTRGGQVAVTYALSAAADVDVRVLNVAGRQVARIEGAKQSAGVNTTVWNGLGATGTKVPAGVYLCEVVARGAEGQSARAIASVRLGR